MEIPSVLKKALSNAFFGFGIMTILYSLIMLAAHDENASMSVVVVLLFFPFCLSVALVRELLQAGKLGTLARVLILYATVLASVALFILSPHKATMNGATIFVLIVGVSLLYFAGCLIARALPRGKKKEKEEYVSVYKNTTKK